MTEPNPHSCVVCQKRIPNRQPVCDACRTRLNSQLRELPDLYALLPVVLEHDGNGAERVSGTREAPIPISLDVADLLGPARQPNPTDESRKHPDDQTGDLSVASVLDQWVRDWREVRHKGEGLPVPTVATLAGWLRVRLEWACDHHGAIDEFAAEVRHLMSALRTTLALRRHVDRLEAPCPTCSTLALYRESGIDYVECGFCGRLWTHDEYRRLAIVLASEVQAKRAVA